MKLYIVTDYVSGNGWLRPMNLHKAPIILLDELRDPTTTDQLHSFVSAHVSMGINNSEYLCSRADESPLFGIVNNFGFVRAIRKQSVNPFYLTTRIRTGSIRLCMEVTFYLPNDA